MKGAIVRNGLLWGAVFGAVTIAFALLSTLSAVERPVWVVRMGRLARCAPKRKLAGGGLDRLSGGLCGRAALHGDALCAGVRVYR
jgi:hypothetical protein